jgi:hypothetical protein
MSGRDGPPPLNIGLGPVLRLICKGVEALKKGLQNSGARSGGAEPCPATRGVRAMDLIDTIREFARRLKLEHDSSAGSTEQDFGGLIARLRFRVCKRLDIPEYEQDVEFGPYKATLSAQNKGQPIRESDWLILRVKALGTEEEARKVGEKLKAAVALSSARRDPRDTAVGDGNHG